jgi:hypothetical protein
MRSRGHATTDELVGLERLQAWEGLARLDSLVRALAHRPNFFRIVHRVIRDESVHSDVVAWLLDPNEWHGLGDAFAKSLAGQVLSTCGEASASSVEIAEVRREFSTGRGPVDIFVRGRIGGRDFALGIENKIDSPESESQLWRYARGITDRFPTHLVVLAFLTLEGLEPKNPPECSIACLSYRDVASHLEPTIASTIERTEGTLGLQLARQYLETLRTDVMAEANPEIEALCRTLYEDHRDAWGTIRRRLPSERDEMHASLGQAAVGAFLDHFKGDWRFSVRRDRHARLYRPAWGKLGTRKDRPIIGLEPPVDWTYAAAHLRLSTEVPDTDAETLYRYTVRLRVDTRHAPKLGRAVAKALARAGFSVPDRNQFTIGLKSTAKLPPVIDKPDSVSGWIVRLKPVRDAVSALDSVLS